MFHRILSSANPPTCSRGSEVHVLFFDDSHAVGVGDPSGLGWVGCVSAATHAAGTALVAYNLGVRGQTSQDVLRLWRSEANVRSSDLETRVVFAVGANDTTGEDAREFVLILAGLLEETAAGEPLDSGERLAAHEMAGRWREQAASEESPEPGALLSVAEVAAHFGVTPQGVYKWCEAAKIEFERTPGGGYRIPAAQFDWARGQEGVRARRQIAERLMAKRGAEKAPGEEEMVAAMRKARRGG